MLTRLCWKAVVFMCCPFYVLEWHACFLRILHFVKGRSYYWALSMLDRLNLCHRRRISDFFFTHKHNAVLYSVTSYITIIIILLHASFTITSQIVPKWSMLLHVPVMWCYPQNCILLIVCGLVMCIMILVDYTMIICCSRIIDKIWLCDFFLNRPNHTLT